MPPTNTPTCTPASTRTPTSTNTPTNTPIAFPARAVVISEVAWGGTAANASDEWIELYNNTNASINLSGWTLKSDTDNSPNISLSGAIPANGFYLLERTDDTTISNIPTDLIYAGDLNNAGETLTLRDPATNVIDTANGNGGGWRSGTASPNYYSMERINSLSTDSDTNWASNDSVHRNGLDANGNAINGTPKQLNSASFLLTATPTSTSTSTPINTPTSTRTNTPTNTPTSTPTPTAVGAPSKLLITEVLYDGTQSNEDDEFVEPFNPNDSSVDLSNYKIGDEETFGGNESMYRFPAGTTIAANEVIIIAKNVAVFFVRFPTVMNRIIDLSVATKYSAWANGSFALANTGDEVLLLGPSDQIIDSVVWENGNYVAGGLYYDPNDKAKPNASAPNSLQRYGMQDVN